MLLGSLVKLEAEQFTVRDGKLYLNFDSDTQAKWLKAPAGYIKDADTKFQSLFFKFTGSPDTVYICEGKLDPWAASLGFAGVFAPGGSYSANAVGSSCWPAVSGCLVRCFCGFGAKSGRVGWRRRRIVDDGAGAFRPDRRRDLVPLIAWPAMLALLNRAGAGRPFALAPR